MDLLFCCIGFDSLFCHLPGSGNTGALGRVRLSKVLFNVHLSTLAHIQDLMSATPDGSRLKSTQYEFLFGKRQNPTEISTPIDLAAFSACAAHGSAGCRGRRIH